MATGDSVVQVLEAMQPNANAAQWTVRTGGSTPAERFLVLAFDGGTTDEHMDYKCVLRGYAGGGLTFSFAWSAATATSGTVRWGCAIRRLNDDAEDLDAAHTYDYNEATDTAASASGEGSYFTIAFTDGADMDSLANGEMFIFRVRREASDTTNDNMTGDAELWGFDGRET